MTSTRRMGSVDSAKAESMLDAAEVILRDEGYAALTSRRVAEYLDVKQRLVYYYFRTMDDLILATLKRLSSRELDRLKAASSSDRPLHEIWNVCINTVDARIVSELMALANHTEGMRSEVISFVEKSRSLQVAALKRALATTNTEKFNVNPEALAIIGSSLVLTLNAEALLGVDKGHAAVKKMIKNFFDTIEPQRYPEATPA
jgi:AcrR family transcriptional regulator